MIDPIVHGALVIVFQWLVNLLLVYLGIDLGGDVATGLATWLVGYILSLFGYSTYKAITNKVRGIAPSTNQYVPPFTS